MQGEEKKDIGKNENEVSGLGFSEIEELIAKLDPAKEVTITDVTGKSNKLSAFVSARKQIRIFKKFKELSEMESFVNAESFNMDGNIVSVIVELASNEEVAEKLGEIFSLAYPELYEDPLDELPLEELVGAIIPFCLRFLKKVGGGMTAVMGQMNQS